MKAKTQRKIMHPAALFSGLFTRYTVPFLSRAAGMQDHLMPAREPDRYPQ
jgi:hypothetical protein